MPSEYEMRKAILSQPESFVGVIERNISLARTIGASLATKKRVFVVGTGSSYHASVMGKYIFERYSGLDMVITFTSFDFANYTPKLTRNDAVIVVSHRGYKRYSLESLQIARAAGCFTVAITGQESSLKDGDADEVVHTVPQEISSAHTVSLTSTVSALLAIALETGKANGVQPLPRALDLGNEVSQKIKRVLSMERSIRDFVETTSFNEKIWFTGGGPNAIVAPEAALKVQETSYLDAGGYELEQLIHGPMRSIDLSKDLLICVDAEGKSSARMKEFLESLRAVGAYLFVVTDTSLPDPVPHITVPRIDEALSPILNLVALQLLAYHIALKQGTNPDTFRSTDEKFAKIDKLLKL